MKIIKYGTITISKDDIVVTGFHIDGEKGNPQYHNAQDCLIAWAIERLTQQQNLILGFLKEGG